MKLENLILQCNWSVIKMKLIIDVDVNQDENTIYGWYLYGYIVRDDNTISKYITDLALLNMLNLTNIKEYRNILSSFGTTTLANGRTCFKTEVIARTAIPLITTLINYNIIC